MSQSFGWVNTHYSRDQYLSAIMDLNAGAEKPLDKLSHEKYLNGTYPAPDTGYSHQAARGIFAYLQQSARFGESFLGITDKEGEVLIRDARRIIDVAEDLDNNGLGTIGAAAVARNPDLLRSNSDFSKKNRAELAVDDIINYAIDHQLPGVEDAIMENWDDDDCRRNNVQFGFNRRGTQPSKPASVIALVPKETPTEGQS